jgi:hypothetical protein
MCRDKARRLRRTESVNVVALDRRQLVRGDVEQREHVDHPAEPADAVADLDGEIEGRRDRSPGRSVVDEVDGQVHRGPPYSSRRLCEVPRDFFSISQPFAAYAKYKFALRSNDE